MGGVKHAAAGPYNAMMQQQMILQVIRAASSLPNFFEI
jgi:predicted patatin/cPLA2 family phospholipase